MNGSLLVCGLFLAFVPLVPWIVFSSVGDLTLERGFRRLAMLALGSYACLAALKLLGGFSWLALALAIYMLVPFHLAIFFAGSSRGNAAWPVKLVFLLIHLTLLVGQTGALMILWSWI